MRYSSRYGQKGNSSYNVAKTKGRKPLGETQNYQDKDDYETRSASTTASTASDDEQALGMSHTNNMQDCLPPPPPPPTSPVRFKTPLGKTKLTSGAALFVPQGLSEPVMPPAPIMMPGGPTPGKDALSGIIESTLGSEVWDLSMVDCIGAAGEWYTAVAITIPALTASMVHLATSQDTELVAAAQQATQSLAVQSLIHSLQNMSPHMVITPSEDTSRLSVEYCGADRDRLCWEFSHLGQCPRGASCRWQHAMVETFLISIMLQPLMNWGLGQPEAPPQESKEAQATVLTRWQPQRAPQPPRDASKPKRNVASLPLTTIEHKGFSSGDDDDTPFPDYMEDRNFGMPVTPKEVIKCELKVSTPPTLTRRPRVGRSWADIQEDSDGDEIPLPQWN